LIDIFENSDYFYLVLELMNGSDLYHYIKSRKGELSENRIRDISLDIANGLSYMHSLGIVHRDMKLENIMMTDNSENATCKLADFGLSKIMTPTEKTNEVVGSLGFCAPEVL
jgi:serine/threonine protein kinase